MRRLSTKFRHLSNPNSGCLGFGYLELICEGDSIHVRCNKCGAPYPYELRLLMRLDLIGLLPLTLTHERIDQDAPNDIPIVPLVSPTVG